MFVALDTNGNRIYADSADKETTCFCPVCNEALKLRKGGKNRPHFAHLADSECFYGRDQDYKSEWHIRMQDYFPRESCEVRFVDTETGEVHIADVFLASCNTVLEFQHSPIPESEFISRTKFHLKNGRRIVWLFDESSQNKESNFGRFRYDPDISTTDFPYYQWMRRPRQFLIRGPELKQYHNLYSVCVYTGTEGDVFHRIVDQQNYYKYVGFSENTIQMGATFNVETFFNYDPYWIKEDQKIALQQAIAQQQERLRQDAINNALIQFWSRPKRRGRRRF